MLQTIRLKAGYNLDYVYFSINDSYCFILSFNFYGDCKFSQLAKLVLRKYWTSCPLDFPDLNAGKSQLVRMTSIPVFIFMPNQVPVDLLSLPAMMFGSSAKGPILFVLLPACSSLLNAITNFILFLLPSFKLFLIFPFYRN